MPFRDRRFAGRLLGERLVPYRDRSPVVLGLPRGGVPVALEVARALGAPLDVLVVRKLGHPAQPELAIGAVGEGGHRVLNDEVMRRASIERSLLDAITEREVAEVHRRVDAYRRGKPPVPVGGRTVIVVDDGLATGSTAQAAIEVLRARDAGEIVLAVPVAPRETLARLEHVADDVVCLETPEMFMAVGQWYDDFSQTSDEEVEALLDEVGTARSEGSRARDPGPMAEHEVEVELAELALPGLLTVPSSPGGVVVFAHGSGSSRLSPRNRQVAAGLVDAGLATLLFDLLTDAEAADRSNVFDIQLLGDRLVGATVWLIRQPRAAGVPLGFFGASTGAAAALVAAAELGDRVAAVVSRGGRPDLAAERLRDVRAPTLLVVGGHDPTVVELNREAQAQLECPNRLEIVPGATHLFEEPGTLEQVTELARRWFVARFDEQRHDAR